MSPSRRLECLTASYAKVQLSTITLRGQGTIDPFMGPSASATQNFIITLYRVAERHRESTRREEEGSVARGQAGSRSGRRVLEAGEQGSKQGEGEMVD